MLKDVDLCGPNPMVYAQPIKPAAPVKAFIFFISQITQFSKFYSKYLTYFKHFFQKKYLIEQPNQQHITQIQTLYMKKK